jgi:hypothetical protein
VSLSWPASSSTNADFCSLFMASPTKTPAVQAGVGFRFTVCSG